MSHVVSGAYGASFRSDNDSKSNTASDDEYDSILQEVIEFEKTEGRRPRILVAKLGKFINNL